MSLVIDDVTRDRHDNFLNVNFDDSLDSSTINPAQTRYTITKRELLSIVEKGQTNLVADALSRLDMHNIQYIILLIILVSMTKMHIL